mmetsp:Transcript_58811/g.118117  ORF Transcript_58811/g.118117 Transcript_58811/m.118117 type:complete len:208 (+) Transcript_58811:1114-1737(+)
MLAMLVWSLLADLATSSLVFSPLGPPPFPRPLPSSPDVAFTSRKGNCCVARSNEGRSTRSSPCSRHDTGRGGGVVGSSSSKLPPYSCRHSSKLRPWSTASSDGNLCFRDPADTGEVGKAGVGKWGAGRADAGDSFVALAGAPPVAAVAVSCSIKERLNTSSTAFLPLLCCPSAAPWSIRSYSATDKPAVKCHSACAHRLCTKIESGT